MSRRQHAKQTFTSQRNADEQNATGEIDNPRYLFASFLTSLLIIAVPTSAFEPATTVFAIAGIGLSLYKYKWYWPTVFVVALIRFVFSAMFTYDNHEWLFLYWLLALSIFVMGKHTERQFQLVSRLLIGLTFLFATAWKVLSPEFRSGAFFEFAAATESRLTDAFSMMGLISKADVNANLHAITAMKSVNTPATFGLTEVSGLDGFWMFLTVATIIIEGAIAITFLAPLPRAKTWIRDAVLGTFAVGTYLLMPVLGFGQLLCILGYASSDLEEKKRKYVYVGLLVFIQATTLRDTVLSWLT